jgi:hypothetical protein
MWASEAEKDQRFLAECACPYCGAPAGECCHLCPYSRFYLCPELEREMALEQDAMSDAEWFSAAAAQYELVHGEAYCS